MPLGDVLVKSGAVEPKQKEGIFAKLGVTTGTIFIVTVDSVNEVHWPALGVKV